MISQPEGRNNCYTPENKEKRKIAFRALQGGAQSFFFKENEKGGLSLHRDESFLAEVTRSAPLS